VKASIWTAPQLPSPATPSWRALTRYIDGGQLEIDDKTAERALRVV
jgi:hypothetical protein